MMIIIIMLHRTLVMMFASYMHWLYTMRYFSVTNGRTDEQGDSRSRMAHRCCYYVINAIVHQTNKNKIGLKRWRGIIDPKTYKNWKITWDTIWNTPVFIFFYKDLQVYWIITGLKYNILQEQSSPAQIIIFLVQLDNKMFARISHVPLVSRPPEQIFSD